MKDIVTEVRELQHGVRVTVNDRLVLRLTRKDCKTCCPKEGDAVDAEKWKHDLLLSQYPDALNRAVRLLAVRARSRCEIEKRLTDACYLDDTVEMVITRLQSDGLVDDRAFAEQWARERTARQIGKARILHELRLKGVDGRLAERAVSALGGEAQGDSAARLAAKLRKRYQALSDGDARRKIIPAMRRRGFTYSEALSALDKAEDND